MTLSPFLSLMTKGANWEINKTVLRRVIATGVAFKLPYKRNSEEDSRTNEDTHTDHGKSQDSLRRIEARRIRENDRTQVAHRDSLGAVQDVERNKLSLVFRNVRPTDLTRVAIQNPERFVKICPQVN